MIELTFTCGQADRDHVRIRGPGVDVTLSPPREDAAVMPHALLCFAVESLLNLEGFVRRLGAGLKLDEVHLAQASALPLESSQAAALVEALSEHLSPGASMTEQPALRLLGSVQEACRRRGIVAPSLSVQCTERVRSLALELQARWSELHAGESITLTLPDVRRRISSPEMLSVSMELGSTGAPRTGGNFVPSAPFIPSAAEGGHEPQSTGAGFVGTPAS